MTAHFNRPPGWPAEPPGWVPPPGWRPDPAWPAPPAGWELWIDEHGRPPAPQSAPVNHQPAQDKRVGEALIAAYTSIRPPLAGLSGRARALLVGGLVLAAVVGIAAAVNASAGTSASFTVETHDIFKNWSRSAYGVDTSGWSYDTNACDMVAESLHAAMKDKTLDLDRAQVLDALSASGGWGYTLRNNLNYYGHQAAVEEIVQTGTYCADYIAKRY
jgi:hypothetical protein